MGTKSLIYNNPKQVVLICVCRGDLQSFIALVIYNLQFLNVQ